VNDAGSEAAKRNWANPVYRSRQAAVRPRPKGSANPNYKGGRTIQFRSEYNAYFKAKDRCTNPKSQAWPDYGGRGIKFLFTSFEEFLKEIGPKPTPKHTLDRLRVNEHYELGNVHWATWKEQANNRRLKRIENFTDADILAEVARRGLSLCQT